jgi:hypothetical protein
VPVTLPIPAANTQYFQDAAANLQRQRRRLLATLNQTEVEEYLVNLTTPSFYNSTSQKWESLSECRYNSASRAYICNISASLIKQNGLEVMYVNTVQSSILRRSGAGDTPTSPTYDITTTPPPVDHTMHPVVVGVVVFSSLAGAVVLGMIVRYSFFRAQRYDAPEEAGAPTPAAAFTYRSPSTIASHKSEIPVLDASMDRFFNKAFKSC